MLKMNSHQNPEHHPDKPKPSAGVYPDTDRRISPPKHQSKEIQAAWAAWHAASRLEVCWPPARNGWRKTIARLGAIYPWNRGPKTNVGGLTIGERLRLAAHAGSLLLTSILPTHDCSLEDQMALRQLDEKVRALQKAKDDLELSSLRFSRCTTLMPNY
jgi:hypothetical protein